MMTGWIDVCGVDDIDEEDLISWDYEGHTYAIYHTEEGFFASDVMCTHEDQSLAEGLVIGTVIECPLHQGRFDIRSGKAMSSPVCIDLKTYETRIENGRVLINL